MVCLIFACFNNLSGIEILPSLSNCKLILADNIDVAKKSFFSSKGFRASIALEIFSILDPLINTSPISNCLANFHPFKV